MTPRWTTVPAEGDPRSVARAVARAHDRFVAGDGARGVRPVVRASWERSLRSGVDPDGRPPPVELCDGGLEDYRAAHPLAAVMPVVRRLLVESAADTGVIVAIADAEGRLLWVEGERRLRSRAAADMNFIEGARWSEAVAGTNAPGTALALDREVQIFASEHFARNIAPWSCAAAPIHDLDTGAVLGALDLTGGDAVASAQAAALVRASVAAAEAELQLARLARPAAARAVPPRHRLAVLNRDRGLLSRGFGSVRLSVRHSELLIALARHPEGLSADQLSVLLYDTDPAGVTIRAEMARLKAVVADIGLASRPYRLLAELPTDAEEVARLLDRGSVRLALAAYPGPVLPRSQAPLVTRMREELRAHVRAAVLASGEAGLLLDYARSGDGTEDIAVWRSVLAVLPPSSPRRSGVLAHLDRLDRELGRPPA